MEPGSGDVMVDGYGGWMCSRDGGVGGIPVFWHARKGCKTIV